MQGEGAVKKTMIVDLAVFAIASLGLVLGHPAEGATGSNIVARLPGKGEPSGRLQAIRVVPWEDPLERAFQCEIPAGWQIRGGLIRRNAVDPRAVLELVSPDDQIHIQCGDAAIPVFYLPMPFYPEGSLYSPGYGVVGKTRSYLSGLQFAREYSLAMAARFGKNIQVTDAKERNDIAALLNSFFPPPAPGNLHKATCGEVLFSLERNGRSFSGYCFATTEFIGNSSGGMWLVPYVLFCFAPPERSAEAVLVISHVFASSHVSPEWFARNLENGRQVAEIINKTNQSLSRTINRGWEERNRNQGALSDARQDATMGRERWIDQDGNTYIASGSCEYFFRLPNGQTIGSPSSDPPLAGAERINLTRKPVLE